MRSRDREGRLQNKLHAIRPHLYLLLLSLATVRQAAAFASKGMVMSAAVGRRQVRARSCMFRTSGACSCNTNYLGQQEACGMDQVILLFRRFRSLAAPGLICRLNKLCYRFPHAGNPNRSCSCDDSWRELLLQHTSCKVDLTGCCSACAVSS